jgi:hypothetical protein
MSHVFRTVGTAIGTQMVTLLLATSSAVGPDGVASKHPTPDAFMLAFLGIIAAVALSVVVAVALPRRPHRELAGGLAAASVKSRAT